MLLRRYRQPMNEQVKETKSPATTEVETKEVETEVKKTVRKKK